MIVPRVDPNKIASGDWKLLVALTAVKGEMGNGKLAFFLDLIPERGEKLWNRFCTFQKTDGNVSFIDFVKKTLAVNPVTLHYPKGCMLSSMMRDLLVPAIQRTLRSRQLLGDDDFINIHFGVGESYEAMRSVVCKGCDRTKCVHWVNSTLTVG